MTCILEPCSLCLCPKKDDIRDVAEKVYSRDLLGKDGKD